MRLSSGQICLWAVVLAVGVAGASTTRQPEVEGHKLPALFDFGNYKRVFSKSYGSLVEELQRKRLYYAHALGAFLTGAKYKFRLLTHWQSVNHLSDLSESELERMLNRVAMEEARAQAAAAGTLEELEASGRGGSGTELPEFVADRGEELEAEVEQIIEGREFRTLRDALDAGGSGGRVKRSVDARRKLREFSLDQLMADPSRISNEQTGEQPERASSRVASNNPDYKPIEVESYGLLSGRRQKSVKWVGVAKHDKRSLVEQFADSVNYLFGTYQYLPERLQVAYKQPEVAPDQVLAGGPLPDTMFVDLRQSNCMFMVRSQGQCGSCYAFAATTIMEYLYCKKTNKLVAFSEQYMVDCGKLHSSIFISPYIWRQMDGCEGAFDGGVAKFIHNFGLELRKNYPYRGEEGQCPYKQDQDLKQTGYIRAEIGNVARVHMSDWHVALEHGPLYIVLSTGKDFHQYGGGVYDGSGCRWPGNHAMVLVGHGRENGQEFWLIRNSHSILWGERGYMKLSKEKAHKCVPDKQALAFGTQDGINYDQFEPKLVAGGAKKAAEKSENQKLLDDMVAYINKNGQ